MRFRLWVKIVAGAAILGCVCGNATAADGPDAKALVAANTEQPVETAALGGAGFLSASQPQVSDPCTQPEIVSSPSRPYWDGGAATTQCGIIESDFGWLGQPMGDGQKQWMLVSSVRYGITPKLDLRWGLIDHIFQSGGPNEPMHGAGDQCLGVTYRFHEQGRTLPAMALSYGIKIPVADAEKGFGTGRVDYQIVFIASRDLGPVHLDFDTVGTVTNEEHGHDGAAQFGLAITRQVTGKLALILESYGGPQPGTADRFGVALTGVSYSLRPWLVLDAAYAKTYTAGAPRQQLIFGMTYSMRPSFGPVSRRSKIARLLGR